MKKCLGPTRLPCLGRRSSLLHPSTVFGRRPITFSLPNNPPSWRLSSLGRREWSRPYSVSSAAPIDRQLLRDYIQFEKKRCPVSGPKSKQSDLNSWMPLLEQYLPPSLRSSAKDNPAESDPQSDAAPPTTKESLAQTIELANLLFYARAEGNLDLLAHLGFRLNNWPAVYFLLTRLLDAADALNELSIPNKLPSSHDWGAGSGISLDELTGQSIEKAPQSMQISKTLPLSEFTSFDTLTERPFANDHSKVLMAQVWQSLGSIVLDAADASPNESKLAMSYVFRILARLHHSGAVSDKVYKYDPPGSYQVTFRPPGMHLLSTHIMSVLSDAAWSVHEAEVAAKAAAAGEDSPFLPFKMGVRELGPEIWLEFILWCCVEHGHIQEGVWLIDQMKSRKGDLAWNFQSWKPLLQSPESLWNTNVSLEESWRHPNSAVRQVSPRKRSTLSPFHGLEKRTISVEVAACLLDSLPNLVYLGLGWRGLSTGTLLRYVSMLKFAIASATTEAKLLPTAKASNWFAIRVIESGGFNPEADPRAFEGLLKATPHVVPPWKNNTSPVEEDLERLGPSQLYDDTSAFAGLMEYNIRFYASRRLCTDALDAFSWLQEVVDASKLQRIHEFSRQVGHFDSNLPSFDLDNLKSFKPFESSMPQMSSVTIAELLDLVTTSRAFAFGEWLFFSDDIDGPPIPPSAYGDQALAPSIIRFATATKNEALCDSVVQSLSQPLSLNTMRALLNFRIALGQWDSVVMMLTYFRDYRLKSWGHSNITALAAAITRMEHAIKQEASGSDKQEDLTQAKDILLRILNGEFNELQRRSKTGYQDRLLYGIRRVFLSMSGSLREVASKAQLQYKATARSELPYIPATSFHSLLSAVVDTQGSAAGKRFWERWCLDTRSPASTRLQEGGIPRLYLNRERDRRKGDPHFDAKYFAQVQKKATLPNPNTVRIIAQAAVKEYNEYELKQQTGHSTDSARPITMNGDGRNPAKEVLEFCIKEFQAFRVPQKEINREVGGLLYRMKKERNRERRKLGPEGRKHNV